MASRSLAFPIDIAGPDAPGTPDDPVPEDWPGRLRPLHAVAAAMRTNETIAKVALDRRPASRVMLPSPVICTSPRRVAIGPCPILLHRLQPGHRAKPRTDAQRELLQPAPDHWAAAEHPDTLERPDGMARTQPE